MEVLSKAMPLLEDSRLHFESGKSMAYFTDGAMDDLGKTIIVDFVINGVNKYGLCKIIKPKILECQTEVMNKAESDVIKLKRINNIGNTEFRTVDKDTDLMTKEEMQIYPLNYPTADVSNIYDLQFITNKWQFKIFTKNMISLYF